VNRRIPVVGRIGLRKGRGAQSARIVLSGNSIEENSAAGTFIGTFSVAHGNGTYTFTLNDTGGDRAAVDGDDLEVGATAIDYEDVTSFTIEAEADNGVDPPITRVFAITVLDESEGGGGGGDGLLDFSVPGNPLIAALLDF
jgi:hypothetical protein